MKFYMLVLALDTTTRLGSVALRRDGALLEVETGDPALTHGQRLPGDVMRLLQRQRLHPADVDLFAVASGPGSFTGLRIGIACMQGLAFANRRQVAGISALDALRATVHESAQVAAWMDAQRGEVFSALYEGDDCIDGPSAEKPEDVLARWRRRLSDDAIIFVGDGALHYAKTIGQFFADAAIPESVPSLAPTIATLAEAQSTAGLTTSPDAIRPLYVRRPDAELARDRA